MGNNLNWQRKLGSFGETVTDYEDINQCIKIILTTRKGTDPHRPDFGSDIYKYLDRPQHIAVPNIIRETFQSIKIWEKRIEVTKVTVSQEPGRMNLKINYKDKVTQENKETVIKYD